MPREYCPRCAAEVPVDDGVCFFAHDVTGTEADVPRPLGDSGGADVATAVAEEDGDLEGWGTEDGSESTDVGTEDRDRVEAGVAAEDGDADRAAVGAERPTDGEPSIDPNAFTARRGKRKRGLLSRLFG